MVLPEPTPFGDSYGTACVLIPPHTRVLDVGCGDGTFARHLVTRGCAVVGIEIDKEKAERAGEWCERVIVSDLDDLDIDLGDDRFSVICCLDVLEHLKDPTAVLRRLADALAPGGRIILSIPNVTHTAVRLQLLRGEFKYTPAGLLDRTHLRFFDRDELERMIAGADLRVTDRLYVRRAVDETEIEIDVEALAPEILRAASEGVDANVYQFVWAASPAHFGSDTIGAEALWHELELARSELGRSRAELALAEAQRRQQSDALRQLTIDLDAATEAAESLRAETDDLRWRIEHAERAALHRELIAVQAREALAAEQARLKEFEGGISQRDAEIAEARNEIAETRNEIAEIRARLAIRIADGVAQRLRRHPQLWRVVHSAARVIGR